jgi:hypothetical protein
MMHGYNHSILEQVREEVGDGRAGYQGILPLSIGGVLTPMQTGRTST